MRDTLARLLERLGSQARAEPRPVADVSLGPADLRAGEWIPPREQASDEHPA